MKREWIRRAAVEFGIIFVGVVLAFQFENSRDYRQERAREAEALEALETDFEVNRERLAMTIEDQAAALDAARLWLRATSGEPVEVRLDTLGHLFPTALSWYAEELVSGTFDALVGSGDLGLLRDRELRRRLVEFYGWVDTGFEDHEDEMNQLALLTDLSKDQLGPLPPPGHFSRIDSMAVTDTAAVRTLIAQPGLWGLLAWKAMLGENRMDRLQWLAAHADTIAGVLEGAGSS